MKPGDAIFLAASAQAGDGGVKDLLFDLLEPVEKGPVMLQRGIGLPEDICVSGALGIQEKRGEPMNMEIGRIFSGYS